MTGGKKRGSKYLTTVYTSNVIPQYYHEANITRKMLIPVPKAMTISLSAIGYLSVVGRLPHRKYDSSFNILASDKSPVLFGRLSLL